MAKNLHYNLESDICSWVIFIARVLRIFSFPFQWGSKAFRNMQIIPPGSGIVHQVNLEYLARSVFCEDNLLYPDSLVGTDSHTTMINGLGIVGWGKLQPSLYYPP